MKDLTETKKQLADAQEKEKPLEEITMNQRKHLGHLASDLKESEIISGSSLGENHIGESKTFSKCTEKSIFQLEESGKAVINKTEACASTKDCDQSAISNNCYSTVKRPFYRAKRRCTPTSSACNSGENELKIDENGSNGSNDTSSASPASNLDLDQVIFQTLKYNDYKKVGQNKVYLKLKMRTERISLDFRVEFPKTFEHIPERLRTRCRLHNEVFAFSTGIKFSVLYILTPFGDHKQDQFSFVQSVEFVGKRGHVVLDKSSYYFKNFRTLNMRLNHFFERDEDKNFILCMLVKF